MIISNYIIAYKPCFDFNIKLLNKVWHAIKVTYELSLSLLFNLDLFVWFNLLMKQIDKINQVKTSGFFISHLSDLPSLMEIFISNFFSNLLLYTFHRISWRP